METDARERERGPAGNDELAQSAGKAMDLLAGTIDCGARGEHEEADTDIEEVPGDFIGCALQVVLSIVSMRRGRGSGKRWFAPADC
jgi:hypothetical protein